MLKENEIAQLRKLLNSGRHTSREIIRAQVLLRLQAGYEPLAICRELCIHPSTVNAIKERFLRQGLKEF